MNLLLRKTIAKILVGDERMSYRTENNRHKKPA